MLYVSGNTLRGYPARNVIIEANRLTNFRGTGIQLQAAVNGRVSRNTIMNGKCAKSRAPNGAVLAGFQGIKITDGNSTSNHVSQDNTVAGNEVAHLQSLSACNADIAGNTITEIKGLYCDVGPWRTVFEGNTVRDTMDGSYDQALRAIFAESRCHESLILRNQVQRWGGQAIRVASNNRTRVENNTLFRTGLPIFLRSGNAHTVWNNSCHTVFGPVGCIHVQPEAVSAGGHTINYNTYFPATSKYGKWGTKPTSTSLAAWRSTCKCEANGE
jgi:hypothetical protein